MLDTFTISLVFFTGPEFHAKTAANVANRTRA